MTLDTRGDIAVAQIAFFGAAFLLGIVVGIKQIARHGGYFWLYVPILSILRIIGASVTIYMETKNEHTTALITTAAICNAIGTVPLLIVLMGMLERGAKGILPNIFRIIHVVILGALALAIVGGVYESEPAQNHFKTGTELSKASSVIFDFTYLVIGTLILWSLVNIRRASEKTLVVVSLLVLPFLLVHLAYTTALSFSSSDPSSLFYFMNPNIWVQFGMMFMMEVAIDIIYISTGLFVSPDEQQRQKSMDETRIYDHGNMPHDGRHF